MMLVLEALGPIKHEGPATRYLRKGSICQATSTAAFTLPCQGSFAVTASFALAPLPVTSAPLLSLMFFGPAARSPWQAHGGSVSFNVTEPFPFLRRWHCVNVSLLPPCSCRRESLLRRRLAHRARSRAFGNLSTNAPYSPRPLLCSSVDKSTALCGNLQRTMVPNAPLGA